MVGDVMMVGIVFDSGSAITRISERLAQQMEQHFRGERLVYPCVTELYITPGERTDVVVRKQHVLYRWSLELHEVCGYFCCV